MANQDTRNKLISAAKKLLIDNTNLEVLTARQISSESKTNLAMINYCFKSKDELLKIAVGEILADEFKKHSKTDGMSKTPKEQLYELLFHICSAMIKYQSLTKLSIPYLLLNDEISLPYDILPYIKKHYMNKKNETECKVIAFELICTMQLVFYRSADFYKYSGINIENENEMISFLNIQLDMFLTEEV